MLIMLVENIIFIVVLSIRVQFLRILNAYSWRAQFEILNGNFGYYAQNMYNISISFEYYFQSHLIYKWCYYRQAIFNILQFLRILNAYSWRAQFEILNGNFGYYAQNMYNISISFEYYFQSHLIYKWCYYRQAIFSIQIDTKL